MKLISLFNLKRQIIPIKKEIIKAINEVIESGFFAGGPYVERFEKNFAKYTEVKYAVGINSGTSALHLALQILSIGNGDEVIVPANTFIATVWAVSYVGAKPVFVDCTSDTWQIDATKIKEKISRKTKAVIGVHLFGQPFDVDGVKKITDKYKLFLIEDCAQAHGAKYKEKQVGTLGDIGCFSFYPTKNLGAFGEGGMLVTEKKQYAKKARMLRNQGSVKTYFHDEIGFNMRMDGIQSAVLNVKLKYLDKWNKRRQEIAGIFRKKIKNPHIKLRYQPVWSRSVYHLFVILVEDREKFRKYLTENGIESGVHYPVPCHLQKAYKFLNYHRGDFPVVEKYAKHCVSIPLNSELTATEIDKICKIINGYER